MRKIESVMFLAALLLAGCAEKAFWTNTYLRAPFLDHTAGQAPSFAVVENRDVPNPIFDDTLKAKLEALLRYKNYALASPDQAAYKLRYSYDVKGRTEFSTRPFYADPFYHTHALYPGAHWDGRFAGAFGYRYYVTETYKVYLLQLRIWLLESAPAGAAEEETQGKVIWIGETSYESDEPDLRARIDYLLAALFRYFGKDTEHILQLDIDADDPLARAARNYRTGRNGIQTEASSASTN